MQFADLGLVVVDEQHRFGVEQRAALSGKAGTAAARAGDDRDADPAHGRDDRLRRPRHLDPDRAAGRARRRADDRRARPGAAGLARPRLAAGARGGRPGPAGLRRLRRGSTRARATPSGPTSGRCTRSRSWPPSSPRAPLAGLRVEMLHGRMAPDEKDRVMPAFAAGEVDVLVSTTVIEVGVDVPNATVMVILDADRFGVSQLHQLRGRIGRGGHAGLCLLVTRRRPGQHLDGAAGGRRRHPRRLRALPDRPRAAPRGQRARHRAERRPGQRPQAALGAARRGRHRARPRGGDRAPGAATPSWPRRPALAPRRSRRSRTSEQAEFLETGTSEDPDDPHHRRLGRRADG